MLVATPPARPAVAHVAHLTDAQGYTMTLSYAFTPGVATTSVANDPPGQETVSQLDSDIQFSIKNTTPGRNFDPSTDFNSDLGGLLVGTYWRGHSAICAHSAVQVAPSFPGIGQTCYVGLFGLSVSSASLATGESEELNVAAGTINAEPGLSFSGIDETAGADAADALRRGPALYAISSLDNARRFPTHCAPDGGSTYPTTLYLLDVPNKQNVRCSD